MTLFLDALLGFPAVVYTVLLGAAMIYWAAVLAGALDLDNDGGAEHHDGGDGDGDGDADGDADASVQHGGVVDLLGTVALRKVPLTVRVSLVVIFGWLVSVLGWITLAPLLPAAVPAWALRALLSLASVLLGLRLAGLAARPLVPVFTTRPAVSQHDLAGRDAEVTTGRVDTDFGQVLVSDGGAGLLVNARYDGAALKKGARVIVTHWDPEKNVAWVEPLDGGAGVRVAAVTAAEREAVAAPSSGAAPAARGGQRRR